MGIDLKIARIKKGYKQFELAEKAGISRYYLYKLETGKAKNPSVQVMKSIATSLGVTVEELFLK